MTTSVRHLPTQCTQCPCREECLSQVLQEKPGIRHEVDVKVEIIDTSHVCMTGKCPKSGEILCGEFPAHITSSKQYGKMVHTIATMLFFQGVMSYERISEFLRELFGLGTCTASAYAMVKRTAEKKSLDKFIELLKQELVAAGVLNADESGLNVNGELHWVHVLASAVGVLYHVSKKRGAAGMAEGGVLGDHRIRTLIHDCWSAYWNELLDIEKHGLCGAHLLRELINVAVCDPEAGWSRDLIDMLLRANADCAKAREAGKSSLPSYKIKWYRRKYDTLVEAALKKYPIAVKEPGKKGRAKQCPEVNLLRRLKKYADEVLLFTRDLTVPFTNNRAEQAIRIIVLRQKVSGYFATEDGAKRYLKMLSYLRTLKKRGVSMLQAILMCLEDRCDELLQPA